jgi:hypothetical protein
VKEQLTEFLIKTQNPDGGWGVQRGRQSHTEATAFALLALGALRNNSLKNPIERGTAWLVQRQKPGGGFPLMANLHEPSWVSPLAVVALNSFKSEPRSVLRGAEWVLRQKGHGLGLLGSLQYWLNPKQSIVKLDPTLKGWSWTAGSFSWVEPTAYALIALKKLKSHMSQDRVIARITEGERMIYDRMCVGGGWNYGNSNVFGENLWPYPDTTAQALIALQDHSFEPANQLSLKALEKMLAENHSGLALGWGCLCFALYGRDISSWVARLEKSYAETEFLGETKSIALALLAVSGGAEVFRV